MLKTEHPDKTDLFFFLYIHFCPGPERIRSCMLENENIEIFRLLLVFMQNWPKSFLMPFWNYYCIEKITSIGIVELLEQ